MIPQISKEGINNKPRGRPMNNFMMLRFICIFVSLSPFKKLPRLPRRPNRLLLTYNVRKNRSILRVRNQTTTDKEIFLARIVRVGSIHRPDALVSRKLDKVFQRGKTTRGYTIQTVFSLSIQTFMIKKHAP